MTDDLKTQIREEHRRAELQRLDAGMDGCACGICQEFYRELDLAKYGRRVIRVAGIILIREKRHLHGQQDIPSDNATSVVSPCQSSKGGVTGASPSETTTTPQKGIMLQANGESKRGRGRPVKPAGELASRMTKWRKKHSQTDFGCSQGIAKAAK
ncbi:MAG: hypothetical protein HYX80_06620 [Chloroflexi bacterium]|nr:hypothetical protein [Chloroflexota bacterium]